MMLQADTPWIGLLALIAMFVLPFIPRWLFEGPRVIKHHPIRHICAECGKAWTDTHDCQSSSEPGLDLLRGQLWRPSRVTSLERRLGPRSEADD
jgi:hypothetical protein